MKIKNHGRITAALGLALVMGLGLIPLAGQSEKAQVVRLVGVARVQRAGAWSPLSVNSVINDNDTIETGAGASTRLVLRYKGSEIRLGEKTTLRIETLTDSSKPAKLHLLSGFSWASVKDAGKRAFFIESPTALAGVRGTKFAVAADAHGTTSCVCEGKVATSSKGGPESVVSAGGSNEYDTAGRLTTKDFKKYFKKLKVDKSFQTEIARDAKLNGCKSCHKMTNIATDVGPDPSDY